MKKNKNKIISMILIVMFLTTNIFLEIIDVKNVKAYEKNIIQVVVEGVKDTLYDKSVEIKSDMYVKDLLRNSIGTGNIDGLDNNMVTKIFNEKSTNNMGWMYYLVDDKDNIIQGDSINIQSIKDTKGNYYKKMVFHVAKYIDGITCIPHIKIEHEKNKYTIKITEDNTMMGIQIRPSKDVVVNVEGLGEYKTNNEGKVSFKITPGNHKVIVYKNLKDSKGEEYPAIVKQQFDLVGEKNDEDVKFKNIINDVEKYYEGKELSYLNVLSFNSLNSLNKKNFKLNNVDNTQNIAHNIMGIIAINKNPYNYNGINYVKKLMDSQDEDGEFVIEHSDKGSIGALSDSILALDMASAKYNEKKTLNALIQFASNGEYEDIDSECKALIALSKHKDIKEVNNLIKSCIKDIKEQQLESGGFDYCGIGNSPYSTAPVIQTLIAIGEDPTSVKWSKSGKTPIDALTACKISDNGFEMAEGMGGGVSDVTATDVAFAALIDAYTQKSIYNTFKFKEDDKSDISNIINNELQDIKAYYKDKTIYNFSTIVGLRNLGIQCKELENKMKLKNNFNKNSSVFLAQDIISIIGINKNPRNYKGKNYVDTLMNCLRNSKQKYILNDEYFYSLIALDMASANKEDILFVIEKIKLLYKKDKFKQVKDSSLAITSLSAHKEEEGISEILNTCLKNLKENQLENSGFSISKKMFKNGDSEDTAIAIEALISMGEDPLSEKWTKGENNLIKVILSFKMGNGYIYEPSLGAYEQDMYTSYVLRAFLALKDKKNTFNKYKISYNPEKDKTKDIKNAIDNLKKYYKDKDTYNFREAMTFNYSNDSVYKDIDYIKNKIILKDKISSVNDLSTNIMTLIAIGKNPKKYNGVNYVEKLLNTQIKQGTNKGKFILSEDDGVYATTQAYAILALDMSNADYDNKSAIEAICNMNKNGIYNDIDTTAIVITSLANHKDIKQANDIINTALKFLRDKQNDKAGYDTFGQVNNPCTIAVVIQALIINNQNIFSDTWTKNGNNIIDALLSSAKNGLFENNDFANSLTFMALLDVYKGESIFNAIRLGDNSIVNKTINELKLYYKNKDFKYNYMQGLALSKINFDKKLIQSRIQLREEEPEFLNFDSDIVNCCKNIIGLTSAGFNPKDYKDKNYVDELNKKQNKNQSIVEQAYKIIAFDICGENYDEEDLINKLIREIDNNKRRNLEAITSTMIALSNHRNINGVNSTIEKCLNKISSFQIDNGEFVLNVKLKDERCSEYTAKAIQALVAVGEDIYEPKWNKNGKSPLDALMNYKRNDHFIYDEIKSSYSDFTDEATGMALAALVDLYNEKSMFKSINKHIDINESFIIENITKQQEFKLGQQAKVTIKAINNRKKSENATLIVGLFNKQGEFINYGAAYQNIETNKSVDLSVTLNTPNKGQYIIKAFVWDDLDHMKPLSEVIEVPVK